MIHQLSKNYGIDKRIAETYIEIDYWEMLIFENLSVLKQTDKK